MDNSLKKDDQFKIELGFKMLDINNNENQTSKNDPDALIDYQVGVLADTHTYLAEWFCYMKNKISYKKFADYSSDILDLILSDKLLKIDSDYTGSRFGTYCPTRDPNEELFVEIRVKGIAVLKLQEKGKFMFPESYMGDIVKIFKYVIKNKLLPETQKTHNIIDIVESDYADRYVRFVRRMI